MASLLLVGCGGGGGFSSDADDGSSSVSCAYEPIAFAGPVVSLSGAVRYEHYPATASGLDYAAPEWRAVRRAPIVIRRTSDDEIVATTSTDDAGTYDVDVPADTEVEISVWAAIGTACDPRVTVLDPGAGYALWAVQATVPETDVDLPVDLDIPGGWNDATGAYDSSSRLAGAFAITAAIRDAELLVLSVDPGIHFPDLWVSWGQSQTAVSAYGSQSIRILGYSDDGSSPDHPEFYDTDEYDSAIVIHEWAHFFEDQFSRSDSLGGFHSLRQGLDPTVAFGEGFATAFAGMVQDFHERSPRYVDTFGAAQSDLYVDLDIETGAFGGTQWVDGPVNETSVLQVVYDLYDDAIGDDDVLALGFEPIYQVMVGAQRSTPAFTSLYSFLSALKDLRPGDASQIDQVAAMESVIASSALMGEDIGTTAHCIDLGSGTVSIALDPAGNDLQTSSAYIHPDNPGSLWPGNAYLQRWFFSFSAAEAGMLEITATPDGQESTAAGGRLRILRPSGFVDASDGDGLPALASISVAAGETVYFAVGSYEDATYFDLDSVFTPDVSKVAN